MNHINQEQLVDYLHRGLAPEDDAMVHAHLDACAQCRLAYQDEASLSEALRANARNEIRELPSGVVASIWAAIAAARRRESLADRLLTWLRPAVLVPAMAVVVLALLLVPRFAQSPPSQTIDASYYLQDHAALGSTMPFADSDQVPEALENDDEGQTSVVAVMPAVMMADVAP